MRKELSIGKKIFFTVIVGTFIVVLIFMIFNFTVGASLKEVKTENQDLETQISTLQEYVVHMDEYLADTDKFAKDVENIINSYQSDTSAPSILHDYENIFKEHKLESSALSYQNPEVLNSVSYNYQDESYSYDLQSTQISITYKDSYDGLMKLISELNNDLKNECLTQINISPDTSDGSLTGSANIIKYTIKGETRDSDEPKLDNIPIGVERIFDTTATNEGD